MILGTRQEETLQAAWTQSVMEYRGRGTFLRPWSTILFVSDGPMVTRKEFSPSRADEKFTLEAVEKSAAAINPGTAPIGSTPNISRKWSSISSSRAFDPSWTPKDIRSRIRPFCERGGDHFGESQDLRGKWRMSRNFTSAEEVTYDETAAAKFLTQETGALCRKFFLRIERGEPR